MHFSTMLAMSLPNVPHNPEWETQARAMMSELDGKSISASMARCELNCCMTSFGAMVKNKACSILDQYCTDPSNQEYMDFADHTNEVKEEFAENANFIILPDGRIVEEHCYPLYDKFIIKDGKVFEQRHSPWATTLKRTKKAKKMRALVNCPRSKVYKTFENFAEESEYLYDPETGRCGYWFNPNGVFDWCSIGGRWPHMFLVKETCPDYSCGEVDPLDFGPAKAPEGYRWVACARKMDIEWEQMRNWYHEQVTQRYYSLKTQFDTKVLTDEYLTIDENGLRLFGEYRYRKEQTLDEYLAAHEAILSKYPLNICGIFSEEEFIEDECTEDWLQAVEEYIDNCDDTTVFVSIDYHI